MSGGVIFLLFVAALLLAARLLGLGERRPPIPVDEDRPSRSRNPDRFTEETRP